MKDEPKSLFHPSSLIPHPSSFILRSVSVDPPQPERIRDDLKGVIKGELLFDDLTRALYSTDASIFEVRPAGVVAPAPVAVPAVPAPAVESRFPAAPPTALPYNPTPPAPTSNNI